MADIVITGVSSFVGHHLARHLAERGHRVVATLSRPRAQYHGIEAERLAVVEPLVDLVRLNLREHRHIAELLEHRAPSVWIQHAGFATDYSSLDYNLETAHLVNVAPLTALYSALRGSGCGVIVTGSSAEYSASDTGNRESDACVPDTPYGLSKLTQTLRARQLAEQMDVPTRVARLYIPFGSLDNPHKLLAQTIAKLRLRLPVALSPCEQRRDCLGVTDVCDFYDRLVEDLPRTRFDIFNVAAGQPTVLRDLLTEIARLLGAAQDLLRFGAIEMRAGEPAASYADIDKARGLLKWAPTPLSAALERDLLAAR